MVEVNNSICVGQSTQASNDAISSGNTQSTSTVKTKKSNMAAVIIQRSFVLLSLLAAPCCAIDDARLPAALRDDHLRREGDQVALELSSNGEVTPSA